MENTPIRKPFYQKKAFIIIAVLAVLGIIGNLTSSKEDTAKESVATVEYLPITDIENITFYDEEEKVWLWGANFKTDLPPATKLTCAITALDKDGKSLATDKYDYNVVNMGVVVRYGDIRWADPVSEETAKAISSFDIKCNKA